MDGKGNNFTTHPPLKRCHFIALGITNINEIFPDDMSPSAPVFLRRNARRRSGIESMAGKGGNSTTPPLKRCRRRLSINGILPDDILVLILCCLPCQSALTCKLVCKHWVSLISTPSFISRSISRQMIKQQQHGDDEKLYDPMILKTYGKYLFLTSQLLNADISFSFLPCGTTMSESYKRLAKLEKQVLAAEGLSRYSRSVSDDKVEIAILASSDDLILCTIWPWPAVMTPVYICNPFTKESFELPSPPPSKTFAPLDDHIFGFTHKPYYHPVEEEDRSEQEQQHVLVNSTCSFRVVKLRIITDTENFKSRLASEFQVDIFSSETWQWTSCMMQHSSRPNRPRSSISRNGLLYWLCSHGQVIIHDPYNNKVCYVAELLPPPPQGHGSSCCYNFCVSQGSLLAIDKYSNVVSVWELEDEDQQPKWRSVTISVDFYFCNWKPIAVHPNDRNIIYCWSRSGGIATLSLRTGKFKHTFVQKLVTTVNCKSYEARRFMVDAHEIVVLKAPCWPTPISAFLKSRSLAPL